MKIEVGKTFTNFNGEEVEIYAIDWAHRVARLKYVAGTPNGLGGKYAGTISVHSDNDDINLGNIIPTFEEEVDGFIDDPNDNIISPTEYTEGVNTPKQEMVSIGNVMVPKNVAEDLADAEWFAAEHLRKRSNIFSAKEGTPRYFKALDKETVTTARNYFRDSPKKLVVLESLIKEGLFPRGENATKGKLFAEKQVVDADIPPAPIPLRQSRREAAWGLPDPFRKKNADNQQSYREKVAEIKANKEKAKAEEAKRLERFKAKMDSEWFEND